MPIYIIMHYISSAGRRPSGFEQAHLNSEWIFGLADEHEDVLVGLMCDYDGL